MTRQIRRHEEREAAKEALAFEKRKSRSEAKRLLLAVQSAREKDGVYSGRSVASAISPSRSRLLKRKVKKGQYFCRILHSLVSGDREFFYHATKGWRSNRAT